MRLIGITGRARSGKSTLAHYLTQQHGFDELTFASPIKTMLEALLMPFDVDARWFEDQALKSTPIPGLGKTPRQLMQTLGTEWGRDRVHSDLWTMRAERMLAQVRESAFVPAVVFSDVRFSNEADWIHAQGGEIWHVWRVQGELCDTHASESGLAGHDVDEVIENFGPLGDLYQRADALLARPVRAHVRH